MSHDDNITPQGDDTPDGTGDSREFPTDGHTRPTSPVSGAAGAAAARAAYEEAGKQAPPTDDQAGPADQAGRSEQGEPVDTGVADEAEAFLASGAADASADATPAGATESADAQLAAERLVDLQRLNAEYTNYRRRVERERTEERARVTAGIVESMLPVLDEIHLAREHGDLAEGTPFAKIAQKLEGILGGHGVETFGAVGETFDPALHEALMHTTAELPEGTTDTTIVMVMQPGYRIGDRVVRPARVSVADPA